MSYGGQLLQLPMQAKMGMAPAPPPAKKQKVAWHTMYEGVPGRKDSRFADSFVIEAHAADGDAASMPNGGLELMLMGVYYRIGFTPENLPLYRQECVRMLVAHVHILIRAFMATMLTSK